MRTETRDIDFDGHRLAYRVVGLGPPLVVLSQYWRAEDEDAVGLLGSHWQVFHITPVGYGDSHRAPGYAGEQLVTQVLAVLDQHKAHRFVIWGYSAGAAMAACVARSAPRAAGLICGGLSLFDPLSPGTMRQLDRRLHPDHASRSLWSWVSCFDWTTEIVNLPIPCLIYWGSDDRQMAKKLRRSRAQLWPQHVDFRELPGLDHRECNSSGALQDHVVRIVEEWTSNRVGSTW